jgi:uncharacterized protein (DUF1778 family)
MGRLTIDVTDQQHQALKAMAALEGKTIKQYALERLFSASADEQQALEDLRALLAVRVAEAQRGELVEASITEVAGHSLEQGGEA